MQLYYYNKYFTDMELGFRLSYLLVCLTLLILFLWRLRKAPVSDWEYEQKGVALLILALVCLNDPFYPLEFFVRISIYRVFQCLLHIMHFRHVGGSSNSFIRYWRRYSRPLCSCFGSSWLKNSERYTFFPPPPPFFLYPTRQTYSLGFFFLIGRRYEIRVDPYS